jgi:tRNA A37 threonylcarbamoyladenosine dehydratase
MADSDAAACLPLAQQDRRFGGLERLYGKDPAARIRASHVVVVGIGGVGSWAAEALARSGIGRLTLIDMDHVSESNVNRQIQALSSTLGMAKISAMQERIAQINLDCQVQGIDDFVTPDNWPQLLPAGADAVIDACDQVQAKLAMAQWARSTGAVFVSVGAAGGKKAAEKVAVGDLSAATHDPLLAQLRYRLRKFHGAPREGKRMGVTVVYSAEPVLGAQAGDGAQSDNSLNCHGYGSSVAVTASFGMCAAGWVMNTLSCGNLEGLKNNAII